VKFQFATDDPEKLLAAEMVVRGYGGYWRVDWEGLGE
jgi:hypothetical protein